MKIQKFRLERKVLEESLSINSGLKNRVRIIMGHIINENPNDSYLFEILNIFYNAIKDYGKELEKILIIPGQAFLVSNQTMEKLNLHKKEADSAEKIFSRISVYSLRVH